MFLPEHSRLFISPETITETGKDEDRVVLNTKWTNQKDGVVRFQLLYPPEGERAIPAEQFATAALRASGNYAVLKIKLGSAEVKDFCYSDEQLMTTRILSLRKIDKPRNKTKVPGANGTTEQEKGQEPKIENG